MRENDLIPLLTLDDSEQRSWRCPDEGQLAAFVEQNLEAEHSRRLRAHLAKCGHCAAAVAMLVRLQEEAVPGVPPALVAKVRRRTLGAAPPRWDWRWATAGAMATALLVAVLLFAVGSREHQETSLAEAPQTRPVVVAEEQSSEPPALRPEATPSGRRQEQAVVRSRASVEPHLRILHPADNSLLAIDRNQVRWTAYREALYYEIALTNAAGDLVWQSRADTTSIQLPGDLRLEGDELHYLWVRAILADGRSIQSPVVQVRAGTHP